MNRRASSYARHYVVKKSSCRASSGVFKLSQVSSHYPLIALFTATTLSQFTSHSLLLNQQLFLLLLTTSQLLFVTPVRLHYHHSKTMATNIVPKDMWICHECEGTNMIPLADKKCPTCPHYRCDSCYGPGAQRPPPRTNMSLGQQDLYRQRRPARTSTDYEPIQRARSSIQRSNNPRRERLEAPSPFATYTDIPKDIWVCNECGSENLDWYDACPICGAAKPE
ncbi:hypothetical protein BDV96DRAFT_110681 [Lophiotrema nucula]|uniref:RanBP2-type domain-containing protein n=1 Tax=Lophiotrema nucula TaxID=690887 RepID=A0A6A5Z565_9PLEO|nr:hypothetical protein BDV96DRAFT_110681 [Lophiotrema nucula]